MVFELHELQLTNELSHIVLDVDEITKSAQHTKDETIVTTHLWNKVNRIKHISGMDVNFAW